MRVNEYLVLSDCVERGVEYGYHRAYKYTDEPSPESIRNEVCQAVLNEICEYFIFGESVESKTSE